MNAQASPPTSTHPARFAGWAFLIFGYAALAFGLYQLAANTWLWVSADAAEGRVVGWEYMEATPRWDRTRNRHLDVNRARATVVSYQTAAGEEVVFVTEWGSEAVVYPTGSTVTVLYRPDAPENAKIRGFVSLYLGPLLLLVFGAGMWVTGQFVRLMFR